MSYSNFFKIIIILTIVFTICIGLLKPKIHTSVMVQNSEYGISNTDIEMTNAIQTIPTISTEQVKNTVKKADSISVANLNTKNADNVVKEPVNAKSVSNTKVTANVLTQKPVVKKEKTAVKPVTSTVKTEIKMEEEIVWNKWRSDIQNQLMKDVQLPIIPQGTVFKFQFDVDKYGRISNVKTWSLTNSFTPYAIQYIAPVIKSYQGRELLNFPSGSNRTVTTVEGGWRIGKVSKYSTPNDYHDTEKVVK